MPMKPSVIQLRPYQKEAVAKALPLMRDGGGLDIGAVKTRFWAKVRKTHKCWEWTAATAKGYGRFCVKKPVITQAHRMSWMLLKGAIPNGMWVLHKCDNRRCVNPKHLFLGKALDNMLDCVSKGRFNPKSWALVGEDGPNAKLTAIEVRRIRTLHATGASRTAILKQFPKISYQGLGHILRRECWKYV